MSVAELTSMRDAAYAAYIRACSAQAYSQGRNQVTRAKLKDLLDDYLRLDEAVSGAGPMCSVGRYVEPT